MTTEELSILITIFVSIGIIVFFISTLIKQYYHRKYKKIQMTVISIYYNGYYYQNE